MQPSSDSHQPHASAEERLAKQAREIQQLREQLAWASVKEGPTLPALSVLELNKALERPQLTQWMRLILSNPKAYVRLRAGEVGEVPRPVEFKGQVADDMMDPGEQLVWRTWDCVNQSQSAYTRRYAGLASNARQTNQQHATLEEAREALGDSFVWRSSGWWGGVLQWQTRQGEWIPIDSPPSGDCQRCTPNESAIVSWCPRIRAQYGSRLFALASYAAQTSPPTIAEALAGILAERARMGATASSIRGFMSSIRAIEDLQWIPPLFTKGSQRRRP